MILCCLFGLAISAKLDNTYLPPSNAGSASGSHFIQAPYQRNNFGSSGGFSVFSGSSGTDRTSPQSFNQLHSGQANTGLSSGHTGFKPSSYQHNADRYNNRNNGAGSNQFGVGTANRIYQKDHSQYAGTPSEPNVVRGDYSYIAPNGEKISVNYVADENGFRARSDQIAPGATSNFGEQFQHSSSPTSQYGGQNRGSSKYPDQQAFSKYSEYSTNQITPFGKQGGSNQFGGLNNFQSVGSQNGIRSSASRGFAPSGQGNFPLNRGGGFDQGYSGVHANPGVNRQYLPPAGHGGY